MTIPRYHRLWVPGFCAFVCSGVVVAEVEIPILPQAENHVQKSVPIEDDVRQGQELADADLVIGRPLDGTNLRDNLAVHDSFPESLYAGFLAKIKPGGNASTTYTAAGHIKAINPPNKGPHFTLSRDGVDEVMDGTFLAVAAFDTPQRYGIEKLLGARATVGGTGGKIAILVGDSTSGTWWVSEAKFAARAPGEPAECEGLSGSRWRVLYPQTLELGDEEAPASFDRVGLYMIQSLDTRKDPARNPPGNRGFSSLSITVAD